ncbi:MAG: aromatic amino acid hydroxylase, partial [Deltaproteobacteria bacterium]|nr:aromatic amino acid hydroxylase [Deltaproteobacteria bacterium]
MATAEAADTSRDPGGLQRIARLPRHLRQHLVAQDYERYTAQDHAVWRYIMRQSVHILSQRAHPIYLEGLRRTGIRADRIPRIEEMNEVLSRIGWAAATVDGFIPPAAFMEFQAHRVLVIAADMRQVGHIAYTPAPDIVHEAAGHAPIIVDERYAEYLRRIGEIGAKAVSSKADFELYEAIRRLSVVKEQRGADPAEIAHAEREVKERQRELGTPSEAALISRLHWWTVEYGLVGELEAPRLYGAGLLSSIGEAVSCLAPEVRKLPYTEEAAQCSYDITRRQPQLFVTPDFEHLSAVLEQFASRLAQRTGGLEGLKKAVASENVATAVWSSGLQVSGIFQAPPLDARGRPAYLRTRGPTALAFGGEQLPGHGKERHPEGFGSPVGRLTSAPAVALEDLDEATLGRLGVV